MSNDNQPRVYGMADQANRDPPASQGMRGERGAAKGQPEFSHAVTLDTGKRVVVSEGNGVAYAEATGRVARPETTQELEVEFTPEPDPAARHSRKPLLLGLLAIGAGAGIYLFERKRRSEDARPLADHETGPLVPERTLPHQLPFTSEISPSASQISASSDRFPRSPDI